MVTHVWQPEFPIEVGPVESDLEDSNDGNDDQHHEADQTDDVDKQVHHQAE